MNHYSRPRKSPQLQILCPFFCLGFFGLVFLEFCCHLVLFGFWLVLGFSGLEFCCYYLFWGFVCFENQITCCCSRETSSPGPSSPTAKAKRLSLLPCKKYQAQTFLRGAATDKGQSPKSMGEANFLVGIRTTTNCCYLQHRAQDMTIHMICIRLPVLLLIFIHRQWSNQMFVLHPHQIAC